MKYTKILLFALMAAAASLAGCGSDSGSSVGVTPGTPGPEVGAQYVGDVNCINCHADQTREWLKAHGNLDREAQQAHNPSYPLPAETCEACHDRSSLTDPDAEGRGWSLIGSSGPARPVVSCEACHGGGSFHFGMGPLPRPIPGVDTCVVCHNENVPDDGMHRSTHIAELYLESRHAEGRETLNARCAMCHTDEGFIRYARAYNFDGESQRNNLGYARIGEVFANRPAYSMEDLSPISCRTCHDPHSGELRGPETRESVQGELIYSREFNTCTSCHQVFVVHNDPLETVPYSLDPDIYGGEFGFDWSDPVNRGRLEYHHPVANPFGSNASIISDTHFAGWFPQMDEDGNVTQVRRQGYYFGGDGLDPGARNSCTVCHDPHEATN
jgi:hypothetical protein